MLEQSPRNLGPAARGVTVAAGFIRLGRGCHQEDFDVNRKLAVIRHSMGGGLCRPTAEVVQQNYTSNSDGVNFANACANRS